ncbi:MAG: hypothetical protein MZV70_75500 [Desulfobacterales bacterium]|nr:hypothetical protein [Desulfobacterales bacterium]
MEAADVLRYGRHSSKLPSHLLQFSKDKRPVVVWNMTRRCNLKCIHCYSSSQNIALQRRADDARRARRLIDDLAAFGCARVLLLQAASPSCGRTCRNWRSTPSTRGCAPSSPRTGPSSPKRARQVFKRHRPFLRRGEPRRPEEAHDRFRGVTGAFDAALQRHPQLPAMRASRWASASPSTATTWREIPGIFDLIEKENIPRVLLLPPRLLGPRLGAGRGGPHPRGDAAARRSHHGPDTKDLLRPRASTRRSSPWTTTPTGPTSTCGCCRKTPNGPRRSWSCSR